MKIRKSVAFGALTIVSVVAIAEDEIQSNDAQTEEIVVVGRSITTSSALVEVARELLVDTAAVLSDIPGASVNRNGLITGIAQYRGMYGDRVAVDIDQLAVISGGPNAMDAPLSQAMTSKRQRVRFSLQGSAVIALTSVTPLPARTETSWFTPASSTPVIPAHRRYRWISS